MSRSTDKKVTLKAEILSISGSRTLLIQFGMKGKRGMTRVGVSINNVDVSSLKKGDKCEMKIHVKGTASRKLLEIGKLPGDTDISSNVE